MTVTPKAKATTARRLIQADQLDGERDNQVDLANPRAKRHLERHLGGAKSVDRFDREDGASDRKIDLKAFAEKYDIQLKEPSAEVTESLNLALKTRSLPSLSAATITRADKADGGWFRVEDDSINLRSKHAKRALKKGGYDEAQLKRLDVVDGLTDGRLNLGALVRMRRAAKEQDRTDRYNADIARAERRQRSAANSRIARLFEKTDVEQRTVVNTAGAPRPGVISRDDAIAEMEQRFHHAQARRLSPAQMKLPPNERALALLDTLTPYPKAFDSTSMNRAKLDREAVKLLAAFDDRDQLFSSAPQSNKLQQLVNATTSAENELATVDAIKRVMTENMEQRVGDLINPTNFSTGVGRSINVTSPLAKIKSHLRHDDWQKADWIFQYGVATTITQAGGAGSAGFQKVKEQAILGRYKYLRANFLLLNDHLQSARTGTLEHALIKEMLTYKPASIDSSQPPEPLGDTVATAHRDCLDQNILVFPFPALQPYLD